ALRLSECGRCGIGGGPPEMRLQRIKPGQKGETDWTGRQASRSPSKSCPRHNSIQAPNLRVSVSCSKSPQCPPHVGSPERGHFGLCGEEAGFVVGSIGGEEPVNCCGSNVGLATPRDNEP